MNDGTKDGFGKPSAIRVIGTKLAILGRWLGIGTDAPDAPLHVQVGADSSGNNPTTPQYGVITEWFEGRRNLGVGEGTKVSWRVRLIGDKKGVEVANIASYKANSTDTSRASELRLSVSSDGSSTPLAVLKADGPNFSINPRASSGTVGRVQFFNESTLNSTTSAVEVCEPGSANVRARMYAVQGQVQAAGDISSSAVCDFGFVQYPSSGMNCSGGALEFFVGGANRGLRVDTLGNVVLGFAAVLATNATDGFAFVPRCAGAPTGAVTNPTGKCAVVVDSTNDRVYFRVGSAWKYAALI